MAADTPGSVGSGGDRAMSLIPKVKMSCEMPVQAIEVDLAKMRHFLYTVAYAEALNAATTRGLERPSATGPDSITGNATAGVREMDEIHIGDQRMIESAARDGADKLMNQLQRAIEAGPTAVKGFVGAQEQRKTSARLALNAKFAEAQRESSRLVSQYGGIIKVLSAVKFVSTVTIKTLSIFTGGAGTAIDWAYSATQEGVKNLQTDKPQKPMAVVVVDETTKNIGQEILTEFNEALAKGMITREEKNKIEGLIGNYKGSARQIEERLAKLEKQIEEALKTAKGAKKIPGLKSKNLETLAKQKILRIKTLKAFLRNGRPVGLAKKVSGKALSLAFLASDVKDAWNEAAAEWRASD